MFCVYSVSALSPPVHLDRSWWQCQMLLLWWRVEKLGARRWPLARARQVVSTVTTDRHKDMDWIQNISIHCLFLKLFFQYTGKTTVLDKKQTNAFVLCSAFMCLHISQMWVFNPVEGAGLYQQHTGYSLPSGRHCGENLFPLICSGWNLFASYCTPNNSHTLINHWLLLLYLSPSWL